MLAGLLGAVEGVSDEDHVAFVEMLGGLEKWVCLTPDQRSWVHARYEAGVAAGTILPEVEIPKGKLVASMVGALPKRPPPMPKPQGRPHTPRADTPFNPAWPTENDDD
jgi:hypothetical protein